MNVGDIQSVNPGQSINPMKLPPEVLQWYLQQQGGQAPQMQGMPPGMNPDQLKQMLMIQMLRQQGGQQQPGMEGGGQQMPQGQAPNGY